MAALTSKRVALAVVALAIVTAIPFGAEANHVNVADPNDTRGGLDIRRVEVHGKSRSPTWKVITYGSWSSRDIFEKGFVLIYLDTFGTKRFDYYALIQSAGRKLFARLYRDRARKRDYQVGRLHDWRVDTRSLSVIIPLKKMRLGAERLLYMWYAETLFTGNRCRRVCFDVAPDGDPVQEPRPDVVATPSPSPS